MMMENFLKTTLESATARELEFYGLSEFLFHVCSGSKERINNFIEKWDKYDSQLKKIIVAYGKGNWTPSLCSVSEIEKQVSWNVFLMNYDKNFKSCTVENEEEEGKNFQPLNFDELVRMSFWKSLYDMFGHKIMKFLFEKCILIFTIEPEIYLIITNAKCCIPLKVSRKPIQKAAVAVKSNKSAVSNFSKNPQSKLVKKGPSTSSEVTVTALNSVSIAPQAMLKERPSTSTSSKITTTTLCNPVAVQSSFKRKQDVISSSLDQETVPSKRTKIDDTVIRWITLKDDKLKDVISDREKTKQIYNVSSSVLSSSGHKEQSVVAVLEDNFFLNRKCPLHIIGKTSFRIRFNEPVPKDCDGLRLPKNLISEGQDVRLHVYKMSETQAKKYKIRIKPRKRKSKKNPGTEQVIVEVESGSQNQENMEIIASDGGYESDMDFSTYFKPYNPKQTLPTDTILYNKSSWSKLPSSHFARKIVSMNEESGINVLMAEMLHLEKDIVQLMQSKFPDELRELRNITASVVSFHKKVKDIHKMIKSCLMHWIMKHIQKVMSKGITKMHRKNRKQRQTQIAKITTNNLTEISSAHIVDVIQIAKSASDPSSGSLVSEKSQNSSAGSIPHNLRHLSQFFPSDSSGHSKSSHSKTSKVLTQSMLETPVKGRTILFQKLKEAIPHSCILSTLSQILHLSGADKLLGSRRNKRAFISFVKKSVMMGGLHCSLQLGQLMSSLHPEDCVWITQIKNEVIRKKVLSTVLQWLFSHYILTFIKTSFYATEVCNSRNQVVFYVREAWKSVSDKLKDRFIKKNTLRRVETNKACAINSRLRLLPKQNNDIRPLISFKESVNTSLNHNDCRYLLNYLISKRFPQGFQDANGVRARWSAFHQSHNKTKNIPLFYVRADIKDAYASVNLNLLKDILVNSFFDNGEFLLKTYSVISAGSSQLPKVRYSLMNKNNRTNWYASIFTRPCIIQDAKKNKELDAKDIILNLVKALDPSVLRLGRHNFEFGYGLPQGWIMSQHLCNLYYGHMEKKYLSEFLERPGELFIRNVDDYFYVSSDPRRIAKFCNKMKGGIKEYNCKVNLMKWTTNIYVSSAMRMPMTICDWAPFCGWKFCLTTGHVSRDFSSYNGTDICCTLTFRMSDGMDSDSFIIKRMGMVTPLRLSSLFFDPIVNCRRRIIMNIFEAALMLAFRFYAICRVVYPDLKSLTVDTRVTTLLTAINRAAKCLSRYVVKCNIYLYPHCPAHICHDRNQKQSCQKIFKSPKSKVLILHSPDVPRPMCTSTPREDILNTSISYPEAFFLVYHAFIIKLSKHSQVFKDSLLPKLRKTRTKQRDKISEQNYNFLMTTVGCKMPEYFLAIKK